jgi:hypothetical protein
MRRTRLVLVTLLALGATLVASASAGVDDGTLSVQGANGIVAVAATGAAFGRVTGTSTVRIVDPNPDDAGTLVLPRCPDRQNVSAKTADPDDKAITCSGDDIRFRIVGGAFRVQIDGKGINLSVAGTGRVTLNGDLTDLGTGAAFTVGTYSVNDGEAVPIPGHRVSFLLDASATAL